MPDDVHPCGKPVKRARWTRYALPVLWAASVAAMGVGVWGMLR